MKKLTRKKYIAQRERESSVELFTLLQEKISVGSFETEKQKYSKDCFIKYSTPISLIKIETIRSR